MLGVEILNNLLEDPRGPGFRVRPANGDRGKHREPAGFVRKLGCVHEITVIARSNRSPPQAPLSCHLSLRHRHGGKQFGDLLDCCLRAVFIRVRQVAQHQVTESKEVTGLQLLACSVNVVRNYMCNSWTGHSFSFEDRTSGMIAPGGMAHYNPKFRNCKRKST